MTLGDTNIQSMTIVCPVSLTLWCENQDEDHRSLRASLPSPQTFSTHIAYGEHTQGTAWPNPEAYKGLGWPSFKAKKFLEPATETAV